VKNQPLIDYRTQNMNRFPRISVALLFAAPCSIACAANLLPNGDFSDINQLLGWTNLGPGFMEFSGGNDASGGGVSGSMVLRTPAGLETTTAARSSCFAVSPAATYHLGGYVAVFGFFAGAGAELACTTYATTNCSGNGVDLPPTSPDPAQQDPHNFFSSLQAVSGTLDPSARSADCSAKVQSASEGYGWGSADFDSLVFESVAPAPTSVTLDGYMSGNWFDPAQAGQGFQLEFTDQNDTLLAIWFVYTPDGNGQNWIYAQGTYDLTKTSVTVPAEILSGAKFPPLFTSSDLHATPWGTITFSFSDCNHGTASWNSTVPGYGSGSMPIVRLTQIAGTSCPQ
jgi:hypothetical protein